MKKTKLTRSLLAACSIVALSAVMYGCTSDGSENDLKATQDDLAQVEMDAAKAAEDAKAAADAAAKAAARTQRRRRTQTAVNAATALPAQACRKIWMPPRPR